MRDTRRAEPLERTEVVIASPLQMASRQSKLFRGLMLAHGDFHNHTLLSDGAGDPARAFESMRQAGLDVAAITDHALYPGEAPLDEAERLAHGYNRTLTAQGWRLTAELAERAQRDGSFVALRGFEWTSPRLGHMNVWFSTHWTDSLSTLAYRHDDPALRTIPPLGVERAGGRDVLAIQDAPMEAWYAWLQRSADQGGGGDGLIGFNHPGREVDRFAHFAPEPALRERLVSLEMFNRTDDYLLRGVAGGARSPLVECLDGGWRVGLIGVSDDHSDRWGLTEGYGRTGLWVGELSRAGVREALLARRTFAARERGFRLDVSANGVRMGGSLDHPGGRIHVEIDLDGGSHWWGRRVHVQVLTRGDTVPAIKWAAPVPVPRDDEPPIALDVDLAADESPWLVVRVSDPQRAEPGGPTAELEDFGAALAYASPVYLRPAARQANQAPVTSR
jgi:hypothetical protein